MLTKKAVAFPRKARTPLKKERIATHAKTLRNRHILRWAATLSPMEMIEESKHGIRGRQLEQIQEASKFSNEEWSRFLQITPRTIQRYRKENSVMDSTSTERALLVAQIVERGREVFGSEEKFKMWLGAPSFSLGNTSPNELLDTTTGMQVVKAELTRIEYGVY